MKLVDPFSIFTETNVPSVPSTYPGFPSVFVSTVLDHALRLQAGRACQRLFVGGSFPCFNVNTSDSNREGLGNSSEV